MKASEIKVGDKLKDNDPRVSRRILTITELRATSILAKDIAGKERSYERSRIFTDDKHRKSGFSLIADGD